MRFAPRTACLAACLVATLALAPAIAPAGEAWDDISGMLFENRPLEMQAAGLDLHAPYRATDDRRVMLGGRVTLPAGTLIRKVYLVIDENPMPVSAVFEMQRDTSHFAFDASMRLNGPSDIHLVVETADGRLLVRQGASKTSGLGACAAPPGTDPKLALKTLGQMTVEVADAGGAAQRLAKLAGTAPLAVPGDMPGNGDGPRDARRVTINFDHPSHSGLQMDQITLLFLPARFIQTVALKADGKPMFTMTGSISLSENPALAVDLPPQTTAITVHMADTEGATFTRDFNLDQS